MAQRSWKFTVTKAHEGLRLDQLISQETEISRRQAREVIKLGGVQVGKKRVKVAGRLLTPGMEVRVTVDDSLGAVPEMDVNVVFEDEWLLVIDKPAGMPTQGTRASDRHDLLALLGRQRPGQPLWLQHRLDTGTSGLLVLAKDPKADVGAQFASREVKKTYLARVDREVPDTVVDQPFGRVKYSKPPRFGCPGSPKGDLHPEGAGACTEEDLLEVKHSQTLVRPATREEEQGLAPAIWAVAEPRTGRTHQIRVHLAWLGCPIVGDPLYGGRPDRGLWLHAWKLSFRHPVTGEALDLVAAPERFR